MRAATALPATVLLATLVALAGPAQAQRLYLCKDAAGRTLTSDQPIPECSAQPVREIDRNGIVRREIAAPLTPAEKQRRIEEAARERAEREALAEQRRADRALLARFHSEADIEAERRAHVDRVREHAAREAQELERARQHRAALEARLATGGTAAPELLLQLREADRAVETSRRRLDDHEAETMQIDARIDAMLRRFRELKSNPQNP
jgi:chromosome segregation ATPase